MRKSVAIAVLIWGGLTIVFAHAQSFPSRPVALVVPFAVGRPVDVVARILAEPMRRSLGQPVVVENVTGAAGAIGVGKVARAPANDGYLISIGHLSTHVINGAVYQLDYDLMSDLDAVAMIGDNPMLIVGKASLPVSNLRQLVDLAKVRQDKLLVGTAGVGSATHVGGVYFQNAVGTKLQFVPYRGAAPALQEMLGGQIDLMVDQFSNSIPQVRAGRIKAYAVTAEARVSAAPEIPTVDEAGLAGLHMAIWYGTWVRRGTPKQVLMRLNQSLVHALEDPGVRGRLSEIGLEIVPRERQTPEALRTHHRSEAEKWWAMIKSAGIKQ